MLIINNRFLNLYDYNFLVVIEKKRKEIRKIKKKNYNSKREDNKEDYKITTPIIHQ